MKRLILHIGTHKTGTSAIQRWLADERESLRELGIWYGATDRPPYAGLPKHTSLYRALVNPQGDFLVEKRAILEDFQRSGCDTLILSEEGLSGPRHRRFSRLSELRGDFDISVICFLRRQDCFVESVWNQWSREGIERRPIAEFAFSQDVVQHTAYPQMLEFWSGIGDLTALSYVENAHGSVAAFARAAALPFSGPAQRANLSPSMNCAALCNVLNRYGIRYDRRSMIAWFRNDQRRHALGSRLRADVLAAHADGNKRLAREYGIVFGSELPDEPEKPLRWPSLPALFRALMQSRR